MIRWQYSIHILSLMFFLAPLAHSVHGENNLDPDFSGDNLKNTQLSPLSFLFDNIANIYLDFMVDFLQTYGNREASKANLKDLILDEDGFKGCLSKWEEDFAHEDKSSALKRLEKKANEKGLLLSHYTPQILQYFLVKIYFHRLIFYWKESDLRLRLGWQNDEDGFLIDEAQKIADEMWTNPVDFYTFIHDFYIFLRYYNSIIEFSALKTMLSEDEFFRRITIDKSASLARYFANLITDIQLVIPLTPYGFSFKVSNCSGAEQKEQFIKRALHSARVLEYPPEIFGYCSWPKEYIDSFHDAVRKAWGKKNSRFHPGDVVISNEEGIAYSLSELRLIAQADYLGDKISIAKVFKGLVERFKPFHLFPRYLKMANELNVLLPLVKGDGDTTLGREIFLCHLENKNKNIVSEFRELVKNNEGANGDYHRDLLTSLDEEIDAQKRTNTIFEKVFFGRRKGKRKADSVVTLTEAEQQIQNSLDDLVALFTKPSPKTSAKKTESPRQSQSIQKGRKPSKGIDEKNIASLKPQKTKKKKAKSSSKEVVKVAEAYPDLTPKENEALYTAVPVTLPSDTEIYEEEMALLKASSEAITIVSQEEPKKKKKKIWSGLKQIFPENPVKKFLRLKEGISLLNPTSPGYHVILERLYSAQRQMHKRQAFYSQITNTRQKMLRDSVELHTEHQYLLSSFQQFAFRCQDWLNDPLNFDDKKQRLLSRSLQRVFSHVHLFPAHQQFAEEITRSNQRYFAIVFMMEKKEVLDPKEVNSVYFEEKNFNQGIGTMVQDEISSYIKDEEQKLQELKKELSALREVFSSVNE